MEEIIIKAHIGAEGSIIYSVYIDPEGVEGLDGDGDDGGECTAPLHAADCGGDNDESGDECPEACEKKAAAPVSGADWRAALEMATDQAVELVGRLADHADRNA